MTPYIKKVKDVIISAHAALSSLFPDIKLRSSFIGYGDYDKDGRITQDQIIVKPFISSVALFQKTIWRK